MKYIVILLSIILLTGCSRSDRSDSNEAITEDAIANFQETVSKQKENYRNKKESEEICNTEEETASIKTVLHKNWCTKE